MVRGVRSGIGGVCGRTAGVRSRRALYDTMENSRDYGGRSQKFVDTLILAATGGHLLVSCGVLRGTSRGFSAFSKILAHKLNLIEAPHIFIGWVYIQPRLQPKNRSTSSK